MRLPDIEKGDILEHAEKPRVYDPVKAREYYLRTRKLKGRKKGTAKPPPKSTREAAKEAAAQGKDFLITLPDGRIVNMTKDQQAELEKYLNEFLDKQESKLKPLMAEVTTAQVNIEAKRAELNRLRAADQKDPQVRKDRARANAELKNAHALAKQAQRRVNTIQGRFKSAMKDLGTLENGAFAEYFKDPEYAARHPEFVEFLRGRTQAQTVADGAAEAAKRLAKPKKKSAGAS